MNKKFLAAIALAGAAALTLAGCAGGASDDSAANLNPYNVQVDEAAAALLPEDIREGGVLTIGTDGEYPPNEYKDEAGNPIGWGIDLTNAIAAKLGLTPEWEILPFDSILPRIEEGALMMGASSFTDNVERQKTVDFVNYLNAGSFWAAATGSGIDPDNACGLTVAVQAGTVQYTDELPARSEACVAAGLEPIEILPFDGQPEVTNAVVNGQADAFSADFPVTLDAVAQVGGDIETVGVMFDTAPYGFAIKKGSELALAVQAALQSLMDDGVYMQILESAGVESGAVESATINIGKE